MFRTNIRFVVHLMLLSLTAIVPASAQHFKEITGTPLSQIAAGRKEVWGVYNSRVYRFNSNTESFDQIPGSLTQIVVGGGTLLQSDEVWGINNGEVYRFNVNTNTFVNVPNPTPPCKFCIIVSFSQIAVGAGYEDNCHPYEVWVLNSLGNTYRYNYCTSQLENVGIFFVNVILPGGGNGFTQIAVSGAGDVWGLYPYGSSAPAVLEYIGGAWSGPGNTYGVNFQQLAVGINDVWAVDSTGLTWTWSPTRVYGLGGVNLYGTLTSEALPSSGFANQIATGGDGVWVIYNNGLIGRFDFQQGGFLNMPLPADADAAAQIAVGSGAGIWVVDISDQVYTFVRP